MANKVKQKSRLRKAINRRQKAIEKIAREMAWRNYWVRKGILKGWKRVRDYLNSNEKNQFMVLQSITQMIDGLRNVGIDGPKIENMLEQWTKSHNMTKEEHKNLKTSETYLRKFLASVYERLSQKDQDIIKKKIMKFDFKLVDDYTLKQVNRNINDRFINAAVPREQFYKWTEEIMCVKCNGCKKDGNACELNQVFEDNFIPESGFDLPNCKFAYES